MAAAVEKGRKIKQLHVVFFPLLAPGHMLPLFDIARQFAARGVKATVVTTTCNAPVFVKALKNTDKAVDIQLEVLKFPSEEVGLPAGIENFGDVTGNDVVAKFVAGILLLRRPLEQALQRLQPRPCCMVSDLYLPWTAEVAAEFGVPRVAFHGSSFFAMSVMNALRVHKPFAAVESEEEEFVVPGLPGEVRLTRSRLAPHWKKTTEAEAAEDDPATKLMEGAFEAEEKSFGVIMNSFDELEREYRDYYEKVMGRRTWPLGPASLFNRSLEDKKNRGKKAAIDELEIKRWLDSKPLNSVVYICFGSMCNMSSAQLREIAAALDSSDQYFIWVIKQPINDNEDNLPIGFESSNREKVLIIRGWSPQVMILDHEATGVFVTHCGWNSTLEGISSGVSIVTWPLYAEQFMNEKLITDVLKVGVSIGASQYWDVLEVGFSNGASQRWDRVTEEAAVGREAIEAALRRVTVGKEAEEIRSRAGKLKEKAWKAVDKGGSSYQTLSDLLDELTAFQSRDEY